MGVTFKVQSPVSTGLSLFAMLKEQRKETRPKIFVNFESLLNLHK
jgi:hypothetical protein